MVAWSDCVVGSISRCDSLGNALLVNLWFCHLCDSKFKTYPSIVEDPLSAQNVTLPQNKNGSGVI